MIPFHSGVTSRHINTLIQCGENELYGEVVLKKYSYSLFPSLSFSDGQTGWVVGFIILKYWGESWVLAAAKQPMHESSIEGQKWPPLITWPHDEWVPWPSQSCRRDCYYGQWKPDRRREERGRGKGWENERKRQNRKREWMAVKETVFQSNRLWGIARGTTVNWKFCRGRWQVPGGLHIHSTPKETHRMSEHSAYCLQYTSYTIPKH